MLGVVVAVTAVVIVLAALVSTRVASNRPGAPPDHAAVSPTAPAAAPLPSAWEGRPGALDNRWVRVLAGIDRRRGAAWRAGDPGALRTVFVSGSVELAADRRMLRGYVERGLHVDGVRMAFVVVDVYRWRPGRVSLLVIDRLGAAVARDGGGVAQPLPRDQPTRHRIVLQRVGSQWRIAAVTSA
jgi:hypothetical protein